MHYRSLINDADRAAIFQRVARVRPDTPRRWGRMTAPQMICHLTDVFRTLVGERPSAGSLPVVPPWRQRLFKLVALQLPIPWPHGVRAPAAVDQERGGTPPAEFATDVAELTRACERFVASGKTRAPHFLFGPLTEDEWAHWGYRHMDHHLRQFGV